MRLEETIANLEDVLDSDPKPEHELWISVITQAIRDAYGPDETYINRPCVCHKLIRGRPKNGNRPKHYITNRECARLWFRSDTCRHICDMLGLEYTAFLRKVML